jgi:pimeloyl-ACP methyl ester carboxylesterase
MNSAGEFSVTQHSIGEVPLSVYTYGAELTLPRDSVFTLAHARKPVFVASHGLSWSVALEDQIGLPDWRPLSQQIRLVRYDAYGHGRSGGGEQPERYLWSRQAADMAQVLDWVHRRYPVQVKGDAKATKVPDIILGGCSMSSAVALHLMCQVAAGYWSDAAWVSRIKALVLTIPPAGWALREEVVNQYRAMRDLLDRKGLEAFLRAMDLRPTINYMASAKPDFKQVVRQHFSGAAPERLSALYAGAQLSDYPTANELSNVRLPVLLLARSADSFHPAAFAQTLSELLPNARVFCAQSAEGIRSWPARVAMLANAKDAASVLQCAVAGSGA